MKQTPKTKPKEDRKEWIGHICIPHSKDDDANTLLASDQWDRHLDVLSVSQLLWDSLERYGLWNALNLRCGLLIDQYEEEWLEPVALEAARDVVEACRGELLTTTPALTGFLDNLLILIATAEERNVAVIFAF